LGGRHWSFPKGHKDEGEGPLEAAKRELKEETGLQVERVLRETPLVERYHFYRRNEEVEKTVSYFPAIVKGVLKLQPEEIQDSKWIFLEEAAEHLTFAEARAMCQELRKILNV
jgi:8-oxo-dGTP pyrophosphatase MutT (NUDIX family)